MVRMVTDCLSAEMGDRVIQHKYACWCKFDASYFFKDFQHSTRIKL